MTDKNTAETPETEELATKGKTSRRGLLKLGAVAAPAVVTLRPAWATGKGGGAYASLALCRIPIPKYVDKHGKPVHGKHGFAPPYDGYYLGEELLRYKHYGIPHRSQSEEQFEAHLKYIKKLGPGDDGFTCLTSLVHKL